MSEDVTRLPKWAQKKIRKLEQEREAAVRALNETLDKQTPSAFSYFDYLSTWETKSPSQKLFYVQTHKMTVNHAGVELNILLRDTQIDISWGTDDSRTRAIAFIPTSYQAAKLVTKENID